MKRYKLEIRTLSPVHIGASADFEPTNYIICSDDETTAPASVQPKFIVCAECGYKNPYEKVKKDKRCLECESDLDIPDDNKLSETRKKSNFYLYTFTPKQLAAATDINKLMNIVRKDSVDLTVLQRFLRDNTASIAAKGRKRAVVSSAIAKKYNEKFGNTNVIRNEKSSFCIEKSISTSADDTVYIPGSSLKGAIRTAILNAVNLEKHLPRQDNEKGEKIEKRLLGHESPLDDPFKTLKTSDMMPQNELVTAICTAENVKRAGTKSRTLPVDMEVIPAGNVFSGDMELTDDKNAVFDITISQIRQSCNGFYLKMLASLKTYADEISSEFFKKTEAAAQQPGTFIVCLGEHGGAENVTIEGLRRIKIMRGKGIPPQYGEHSTTWWYADDGKSVQPFGWCSVTFKEI